MDVDPLDGTMNYVHRLPGCCLDRPAAGGRRVLGIIFDPLADECFVAARGRESR
jgi:fructose-1,6-bisphosphatase/inositol monophosphatase family enzyme